MGKISKALLKSKYTESVFSLCIHRRHSSIKISNQDGCGGIMFMEAMLRRIKSVLIKTI
jgi:hypothetical protein